MKASRGHHGYRRRGGSVAARGAGATGCTTTVGCVLMASARSSAEYQSLFAAFKRRARALAWKDRENVMIETRWCGLDADLTKQAAKDPCRAQAGRARFLDDSQRRRLWAELTRTTPIVFGEPCGSDRLWIVASYRARRQILTALFNNEPTMIAQWLENAKEIAPATERVAFLFSPVTAPYAENFLKPLNAFAERAGILPLEPR